MELLAAHEKICHKWKGTAREIENDESSIRCVCNHRIGCMAFLELGNQAQPSGGFVLHRNDQQAILLDETVPHLV